jgi:hypothetical protein
MIFNEQLYYKNNNYIKQFLELKDDEVFPLFSIQTINFRFEHTNQTGKQIKDRILDYLG